MNFHPLQFACPCGQVPTSITAVGLTSEYELVVHWTCEACDQTIYSLKSLVDCCRECPEPEDSAATAIANGRLAAEAEDARFLHSLGIRFAEE